jgi:hypothetical protein
MLLSAYPSPAFLPTAYYEAGTLEPLPSANDCVARPLLV